MSAWRSRLIRRSFISRALVAVVAVALALGALAPAARPSVAAQFQVGDTVVVATDALNLRAGAGTASGVIAVMPSGTTGTVVGGPQTATGYTWWQLTTSYGTGWAASAFLAKAT